MTPVDYRQRESAGHYEKRSSASVAGVGSASPTPLVTDVRARGPGFVLMRNDGANPCTFEIAVSPTKGGTYTVVPSQVASTIFQPGDQRYETLPAERPGYVRVRAQSTVNTTTAYTEVHSVSD